MLVLTRSINEQVVIQDEIVVEVLQIGRLNVRLGIEAPRSIPVHRREVYESVLAEQRHNGLSASRIETHRPLPPPRKPTPFADRIASLAEEAHEIGDHNAYITLASLAEIVGKKGRRK